MRRKYRNDEEYGDWLFHSRKDAEAEEFDFKPSRASMGLSRDFEKEEAKDK